MASQHIQDDEVARSSSNLHIGAPRSSFRHLSRSPHPYHRRSFKLLEVDNGSTGNEGNSQRRRSWRVTPKSSSDSGTEADDESTGILKGLPAPPTRPRKGLRGIREQDGSPDSGSALDQPWLSRQKARTRNRIDAEAVEAMRKARRRRRVGLIRRLSETLLLLAVGYIVISRSGTRAAARKWSRGRWNISPGISKHI